MERESRFFKVRKQALALASVFAILFPLQNASAQDTREEEVRAAMIYNFARFTRWPEEAFSPSEGRITICTSDSSILYTSLKKIEGKKIRGKEVAVQNSLYAAVEQKNCHILILTEANKGGYYQITYGNTLVISTVANAAPDAASIELVNIGRQTRFIVNPAAAKASGVELSSKLIDLAVGVR